MSDMSDVTDASDATGATGATDIGRFIIEMRKLLGAIESLTRSLRAASGEQRRRALQEIARLALAVGDLARAFDAHDLLEVAEALASAALAVDAADSANAADPHTAQTPAQDASGASATTPPALLGAHDALEYLAWRVERMARAGDVTPATTADLALTATLDDTLRMGAALASPDDVSGASELTLDQLALVRSFASSELLPRDPEADARADAQARALISAAPAFMARTDSGAAVPVFGGMTAEEFDEMPLEMKRIFVQETQLELRELGQLILDFEQRPDDAVTLTRISHAAHTIKGGGATFGFPGFSRLARLFEEVIMAVESRRVRVDATLLSGFGRFLELCERALASAQSFEDADPALLDDARLLHDSLLTTRTASEAPAHAAHPMDGALAGKRAHARGERAPENPHELLLHVEAQKLDALMNELSALAANRGAVARNRSEIARAQADMLAALTRLREKSAQIGDAFPLALDSAPASAVGPSGPSGPSGPLGASGPSGALRAGVAHPLLASLTTPLAEAQAGGAATATATSSGALRASWASWRHEQLSEMDSALRALAEVVADVSANYNTLAALFSHLGQLTEAQETLTRGIQAEAMSIRLARLDEITPRLRISARVAAKELGKLIDLDIQGDALEIDRSLVEELEEPLIQLLRNSIAHGVETPEERLEAGKPEHGRIWVHAFAAGNSIIIEVGDDGRGVNTDLLIGTAFAKKLISAEEGRSLTRQQALSLMFRAGMSTGGSNLPGAAALAGSGIGLSDVADSIYKVKGSITVRSEPNKGAVFQIRAPISLSVQSVLETYAAGQVFALPFALVEHTALITQEQLRPAPSSAADGATGSASGGLHEWRLSLRLPSEPGDLAALASASDAEEPPAPDDADLREIPAYALAETLGFEQTPSALKRAVVIRVRESQVALLVEGLGESDVRDAAVRPLPRPLQRRVARGVVVRPEDGQVALLIDPHEALAQRLAGEEISLRPAAPPAAPRSPAPWVLIVDDSVTIRRTLEQMITQAGFKSSLARDGYEALELMEQELPRVVILDVEMPRLSGLDLLSIMRSSPQYVGVRVAVLTSRGDERSREQAMALGADTYIVKPCPQETLVEIIRRLLSEPESEPA